MDGSCGRCGARRSITRLTIDRYDGARILDITLCAQCAETLTRAASPRYEGLAPT